MTAEERRERAARESAEERAAQGLEPKIRNLRTIQRITAMVLESTNPSTSLAAAVDAEHPEARNAVAPGAASSAGGDDRGAHPRERSYPTAATG